MLTANFYEESFKKDQQNTINNISQNFESHLLGRLQEVDTLAKFLSSQSYTRESFALMTRRFLSFSTLIGTLHIYDTKGDLLVAEKKPEIPNYNKEKNFNEKKDSFPELARGVFRNKKSFIGPVYLTRDQWPYFLYIVPIFQNGEVWGIVSGAIAPKSKDFSYMIDGLAMAADNSLKLTSKKGVPLIETGSSTEDAQSFTRDLGIGDLSLTLNVSPKSLNKRKLEHLKYLIAAYVLGLLASLLIAALLAPKISTPFFQVSEVLSAYESGDFTKRTNFKGSDEIANLGRITDQIGLKIEKDQYLATLWSAEIDEE